MSTCAYAAKIAFAQIIKKYKKRKLQRQAIWLLWGNFSIQKGRPTIKSVQWTQSKYIFIISAIY